MYWAALGLLLITLFCSIRLRDSRLGRAWIAIREDETAAAAMGIPLMRTKTWSYAVGRVLRRRRRRLVRVVPEGVFPDDFIFNVSVFILCMVILGGMGNVWGVIAGAAFLAYLDTEGPREHGGWLNEGTCLRCEAGRRTGEGDLDGCVNVPAVSFGIYGSSSSRHALPAIRALPRGPAQAGVRDRRARRTARWTCGSAGGVTDGRRAAPDVELRKEFGGLVAVNDVDFTIPQGSIVSLIGPNGAGKTTFFNMITGVYKATSGAVVFDGEDITGRPPHSARSAASAGRSRTSACSSR